jgi:hypothetical protein
MTHGETRADAWIRQAKNSPVLATLFLAAAVIGAFIVVIKPLIWAWQTFGPQAPPQVFTDCRLGPMPSSMPTEGHIYILKTYDEPDDVGSGLEDLSAEAGSKRNFVNTDGSAAFAYRCELTNESNTPLHNLTVPVHLTFRAALPIPGQPQSGEVVAMRQGEITRDRDWPFNVATLERSKPYVFYLWNCCTKKYVYVSLPRSVAAQNDMEVQIAQSERNLSEPLNPVAPFD